MSRGLHRKPRRTGPAVAVALVLFILAAFVVVAAMSRLVSGRWPGPVQLALGRLEGPVWTSPLGWGLGAGVAGLGLVLITVALAPGRVGTVSMGNGETPAHLRAGAAYMTKEGLARLVARRLTDLDGVDQAAVSMPGRRLRARVRTSLSDRARFRSSVRTAVSTRLADCGVSPVPKIAVKIVRRGARP